MTVRNFAKTIEERAGGPILGITLDPESVSWRDDERWAPLKPYAGRLLSWAEARPLLDHEWDSGFGGQDCPDFTAWTADRVLSIHEYDGSTSIIWVPRNPVGQLERN